MVEKGKLKRFPRLKRYRFVYFHSTALFPSSAVKGRCYGNLVPTNTNRKTNIEFTDQMSIVHFKIFF